jgi:hypothetical protein
MNSANRSLQSFTRRIQLMMIYRTALKWAGVWVMIMGVIVLAVRFTGALPPNWWLFALLSLIPLIGTAWFVEYRRRPRMEQMRAAFDGENHAGGLVMAEAEVDTRSWDAKTQNLNLPFIQWRGGKAWVGLTLALIFLIVAWLIPVRFAGLISDPPLEIGQQVQQLREQINVLEEENILPPEEAEAKREELERIAEEASGFNPSKTWEALDHLLDTNQKLAQQEAEEALSKLNTLNEAEMLGKALDLLPEDLKGKSLEEGLKQFGDLLGELAKKGALKPENLPEELKQALEEALKQAGQQNNGEGEGGLEQEQLEKLLEALGENKEALMDLAKKLMDNGLIPPQLADQLDKGEQGFDPGPLADMLKQGGWNPNDLENLLEQFGDLQLGGNGGIDRGPGSAPMQFGDPSTEDDAEFKEEKLAPSVPLSQAKLAGVTITAPEVTGGEAVLSKGALGKAGSGGGSALTAPVLPRHRSTINRFFDRPRRGGSK